MPPGRALVGVALVTLTIVPSACGVSKHELLAVVPADAVAVVRIDWKSLRSDAVMRRFGPVVELEGLTKDARLSAEAIDSVVVFSTDLVSRPTRGDTMLLWAPGAANHAVEVVARGRPIADGPARSRLFRDGRFAVAALTKNILAAGPIERVDEVLRVADGHVASLMDRAEFQDLRGTFNGEAPLVVGLLWPQQLQDASNAATALSAEGARLLGWSPLASLIERLGIGRAVAVSCVRESTSMRVKVAAVMQDERSASTISGALTVLNGLASLAARRQDPSKPVDVEQMTVDRRGSTVLLSLLVNPR